jgi:hypothetical protein
LLQLRVIASGPLRIHSGIPMPERIINGKRAERMGDWLQYLGRAAPGLIASAQRIAFGAQPAICGARRRPATTEPPPP